MIGEKFGDDVKKKKVADPSNFEYVWHKKFKSSRFKSVTQDSKGILILVF